MILTLFYHLFLHINKRTFTKLYYLFCTVKSKKDRGDGASVGKFITNEQKEKVLNLAKDGVPKSLIAREIGISRPTVLGIIREDAEKSAAVEVPVAASQKISLAESAMDSQIDDLHNAFRSFEAMAGNPYYGSIVQCVASDHGFFWFDSADSSAHGLVDMVKGYGKKEARGLVDLLETEYSALKGNPDLGCLHTDTGEVDYDCLVEYLRAFRVISALGLKRDEIRQLLSLPVKTIEFIREFHGYLDEMSMVYDISKPEAVILSIRMLDESYRTKEKLEENRRRIEELDAIKDQKEHELEYLDRAILERKESSQKGPSEDAEGVYHGGNCMGNWALDGRARNIHHTGLKSARQGEIQEPGEAWKLPFFTFSLSVHSLPQEV